MDSKRAPTFSLSLMMLLQYAVWGVWLVSIPTYMLASVAEGGLGFTRGQVGNLLGIAGSVGAVAAPFLAGQIADRFINAERWLGILLIVGGIIKIITAGVHDYTTFLALSVLYSVFYMPTLALTNSVAFAHLQNAEKQFPLIRTFGTIGWIVGATSFSLLWLQTDIHLTWLPPFLEGATRPDAIARIADSLRVAGALAIVYGVWAMLVLPKTPPTRNTAHPFAFVGAFKLLRNPGVLVVTILAIVISMIHNVYFIQINDFLLSLGYQKQYTTPITTIGQFSEIVFMAMLGVFLKRLGYKTVLAVGCLAFALRYGLFGLAEVGTKWIAPAACILHGICYGFFFAGSFLYIDRVSPPDIRHSAQTAYGIVILGVGPILAGLLYGQLSAKYLADPSHQNWQGVWMVLAAIAFACFVILALAFRPGLPKPAPQPAAA